MAEAAATPLPDRAAWKELREHHAQVRDVHLRDLFADDSQRGERLTLEACGIYLDYSKNRVTDETVRLLLRHYSQRDLTFRFVSNVDGTDFAEATHDLDAAETLFIVSSKTFTTLETMTNARTAREWALASLKDDPAIAKLFVAVSTNTAE